MDLEDKEKVVWRNYPDMVCDGGVVVSCEGEAPLPVASSKILFLENSGIDFLDRGASIEEAKFVSSSHEIPVSDLIDAYNAVHGTRFILG